MGVAASIAVYLFPIKAAAKGMAHLNLLRKGAGSKSGNLAGFTAVIAGCLFPIKVAAKGMSHLRRLSWREFSSTRFIVIGSPESPFEARDHMKRGDGLLPPPAFACPPLPRACLKREKSAISRGFPVNFREEFAGFAALNQEFAAPSWRKRH